MGLALMAVNIRKLTAAYAQQIEKYTKRKCTNLIFAQIRTLLYLFKKLLSQPLVYGLNSYIVAAILYFFTKDLVHRCTFALCREATT